jgi:adenylyl cyclase-associated protein
MLLKERPGAAAAAPAAAKSGGGGGMSDVFKQLQGGGVTAGLRKVTDAMKAKNQPQRSGVVPAGNTSAPAPSAAPAAPAVKAGSASTGTPRYVSVGFRLVCFSHNPIQTPNKQTNTALPPRLHQKQQRSTQLELDRKWVVEHHRGDREIVVDKTDPKHTVYVYNCHDCVVQVRGKVNAVSVDGCRKTGVVFDTVIASCELVNCAGVQVQCLGTVPTVSVDKCDGAQVFVPARVAARDFQLVTAKSSEVNVTVVPDAADEGADAVEHAVPEQFISHFKDGRLVTVAASHSGG